MYNNLGCKKCHQTEGMQEWVSGYLVLGVDRKSKRSDGEGMCVSVIGREA
jgi:hypothetical protein